MSRRVASSPVKERRAGIAKSLLILGLLTVGGLIATAQQPRDDTPPLPPAEPSRAIVAQKYQIPNKDRRIFQGQRDPKTLQQVGGIVDLTAIAAETDSSDEYHAWHEVMVHAAQFSQTVDEHAARDLTRDDLTGPQGPNYRLELLRFRGSFTKVWRLRRRGRSASRHR